MFGLEPTVLTSLLGALAAFGGLSGVAAIIVAWNTRRNDHRKWIEETRATLRAEMNEDLTRVREAYRSLRDDYVLLDRKHFKLSVEHDTLQRAHLRLKAEYDDLQASYERLRDEHAKLQADLDAQKQSAAELKEALIAKP